MCRVGGAQSLTHGHGLLLQEGGRKPDVGIAEAVVMVFVALMASLGLGGLCLMGPRIGQLGDSLVHAHDLQPGIGPLEAWQPDILKSHADGQIQARLAERRHLLRLGLVGFVIHARWHHDGDGHPRAADFTHQPRLGINGNGHRQWPARRRRWRFGPAARHGCQQDQSELQPGYSVNLLSYLFGSIVAVGVTDLWLMGSLTLFVLVAVSLLYRWLLAMSFDAEFASIRGLPIKTLYTGLLVLIAIAVVLFINVVGLLLVIALMTIAPYIAERWTRSLRAMMVLAALCNTAFVLSGLALSYQLKLSAGPAIILVATLAFFLSYAAEWLVTQRRQSASPLPHPKA